MKKINKKSKKNFDKKCKFCDYNDPNLLQVHRIKFGCEGGEYTEFNTISVCPTCHTNIHSDKVTLNKIKIDRKYFSTSGRYILHYWIGENEFWD